MPPIKFRSHVVSIDKKSLHIAGMAHPLYNEDPNKAISYLKKQGLDTLISLEKYGYENLENYCYTYGVGHYLIDVPDFHAPSIENTISLYKILIAQKNDTGIAIHCMGGNGRTGTMIAAIFIFQYFNKAAPDYTYDLNFDCIIKTSSGETKCTKLVFDTINEIRAIINGEHSVETKEQVEFLCRLEHLFLTKSITMSFPKAISVKPM